MMANSNRIKVKVGDKDKVNLGGKSGLGQEATIIA